MLSQLDTFTFWANICIYYVSNSDNDGCYSCVIAMCEQNLGEEIVCCCSNLISGERTLHYRFPTSKEWDCTLIRACMFNKMNTVFFLLLALLGSANLLILSVTELKG